MITPMRHVTLICRHEDREAVLDGMRDFGAVHLDLPDRENHNIVELRSRLAETRSVRQHLSVIDAPGKPLTGPSPSELVDLCRSLADELKTIDRLTARLHREARVWEPFGAIRPDTLHALRRDGLHLAFYRAAEAPVDLPPDTAWLTAAPGFGVAVSTEALDAVNTPPLQIPARGPERIREADARLNAIRARHEHTLARAAARLDDLERHAVELEDELAFRLAHEGMDRTDDLAWIEGFIPADENERLRALVDAHGAALLEREPEEDDPAPTLLRHNRFIAWIQPVMGFLGVTPGYREVDVGWSFLVFLSIFSGMIVGDAGYGLLLLAGVAGLNVFKSDTRGKFANLLMLMGGATAVWGLLTGNIFGLQGVPALIPALSATSDPTHIMQVCFVLGATHLTLAHGWNLWRHRRSLQALAELGWIGSTWTMYGIAGDLILGWDGVPPFLIPLFIASVILVVLFMTPPAEFKEKWVDHMMLPLSLVNNFVDVVSYVRLYAVGMATFALASSFNGMLFPEDAERNFIVNGLMALILVLGHALNFILAGMGVMVHGIRLNTLEFASHLGLTWSGIPYTPFKRHQTKPDQDS